MLKELPKKVPEMDTFDHELLLTVKDMAAGMTKEEILETFSIDKEKDLSDEEIVFFDSFYQYGKGMAMHKVITNLVESTKGRSGQAAAMSYLRRFAKNFEGEVEGDSTGSFSFKFGEANSG